MRNAGNIENVYYKARLEAAQYNERFSSRDLASEEFDISPSTLRNYENGNVKILSVGIINSMAEAYNAPELRNWYCKHECPLGEQLPIATEVKGIEGITLRLIREFNPDRLQDMQNKLIDICEDGKITEDERPELMKILNSLDRLIEVISEMKLAGKKALNECR